MVKWKVHRTIPCYTFSRTDAATASLANNIYISEALAHCKACSREQLLSNGTENILLWCIDLNKIGIDLSDRNWRYLFSYQICAYLKGETWEIPCQWRWLKLCVSGHRARRNPIRYRARMNLSVTGPKYPYPFAFIKCDKNSVGPIRFSRNKRISLFKM